MDAVALQHIKKSYTSYSSEIVLTGQTRQSRTRQVLRDLSVCFPIGQLTVIVGRSGCGKSTLLKLLAGKEQPDAGQIEMPHGLAQRAFSARTRMSSRGRTCSATSPWPAAWARRRRSAMKRPRDFVRLVGLQDYADLHPGGAFHGHEAAAGPGAGAGQSGSSCC